METRKKKTLPIELGYTSPRWSGEILDCAMPMTFDQYNRCSGNCMYCFSYFQRSLKHKNPLYDLGKNYQDTPPKAVNPKTIHNMFKTAMDGTEKHQFGEYIRQRKVMQWGGLSDPFDMYEKTYGIGLEILKIMDEFSYPISISTKFTWWTEDERYMKLFRKNGDIWSVKFSIINLDPVTALMVEPAIPSPQERLEALRRVADAGAWTILRLRPFIIGYSNKNNDHIKLIKTAAEYGAKSLSTEFFCLENRGLNSTGVKERYDVISKAVGFDIVKYYKHYSSGSGYLRLNPQIKERWVNEMEDACKKYGLLFFVSDAHHKDRCAHGNCCGIDPKTNTQSSQFTEALLIAKKKGQVKFSDIAGDLPKLFPFLWRNAIGFNTKNSKTRAEMWDVDITEYFRSVWNNPSTAHSPFKYFFGLLVPIGYDENNDVIYKYRAYDFSKTPAK